MQDIKTKLQHIIDKGHHGDKVTIYGVEYDLVELAKEHDVELHTKPSKHTKPTKKADIEVNSYADMEQQDSSGDSEQS